MLIGWCVLGEMWVLRLVDWVVWLFGFFDLLFELIGVILCDYSVCFVGCILLLCFVMEVVWEVFVFGLDYCGFVFWLVDVFLVWVFCWDWLVLLIVLYLLWVVFWLEGEVWFVVCVSVWGRGVVVVFDLYIDLICCVDVLCVVYLWWLGKDVVVIIVVLLIEDVLVFQVGVGVSDRVVWRLFDWLILLGLVCELIGWLIFCFYGLWWWFWNY